MGHGGRRTGAGRKPGKKNRLMQQVAEAVAPQAAAAAASGPTPLEVMLDIMRTSRDVEIRLEAAKAAAPYIHKRMPQDVNVDGKLSVPVSITMNVVGPRRE